MNIDIIRSTAAVALADIARKMEAEGKKITKLQTGDPDFETHECIISAANKALIEGNTHYSFSQGLPDLRKRLALQYSEELNTNVSEEQIIISHGAAEGFFAVIASLIEPKDEVLILEPNWPTVDSLVLLMGGKPVKINALKDKEQILKQLDENYSPNTKALCFNTPNNPTGLVMESSLIDAISEWAMKKNIFIIADEVYRFLQFSDTPSSSVKYLTSYDKYIYINSFSKKFAMTGWRIGYVISNRDLIKKILKPSQLAITNVAPFIQLAAIEALINPESKEYSRFMYNEYKRRRNDILVYCDQSNLEYIFPEGAFYLFLKLPEVDISDVEFCNKLLSEYNTCAVPGSAFGESGKGNVRLSFANKSEMVIRGIDQIKKLIDKLRRE